MHTDPGGSVAVGQLREDSPPVWPRKVRPYLPRIGAIINGHEVYRSIKSHE